VNIYPVLQKNQLEVSGIVNYIPAVSSRITMSDPELARAIAYEDARLAGQWVIIILVLGILVMLLRLLLQYISFLRVKRASTLVVASPIKIFQVNDSIIPFSIGNSIFINQNLHREEELKEIIRHEFIHVKQKHSVDIFLSELLCVVNWYNPFAWMIRRAIKVNLEFIADNKVLEAGLDKKQYQYLLLKVIGVPPFHITTQFNFSSLKKRIAMMNKKQSAKSHLLKLLLLLPVLVIVLLAFRSAGRNFQFNFHDGGNYQDTIPSKPPTPAAPSMDFDDFLKRNPSVKVVHIRNNVLTIELKSGGKETYNLSKESEMEAVHNKYGTLPPLPPHPPLPPPIPVMPKDVKSISINETKAVVVLLNGKKEEYNLTKPGEREAFQSKYQMMESPEPPEMLRHAMEMELRARQDEMMALRLQQEKEFEVIRKTHENEIEDLLHSREDQMKRMSKEKHREMELLQKKLQLEAEHWEESRRKEIEKASKEKGADPEKLIKQYELEQKSEMAKRELELLRASKEREVELELMQKKFELDAQHEIELRNELVEQKQKQMLLRMNELQERNALLQEKINLGSKNLSAEQKKEVISHLEIQKQELNKLMQDLKSKESEINKLIQDLKKTQGKN
jgi:hypothetical protein